MSGVQSIDHRNSNNNNWQALNKQNNIWSNEENKFASVVFSLTVNTAVNIKSIKNVLDTCLPSAQSMYINYKMMNHCCCCCLCRRYYYYCCCWWWYYCCCCIFVLCFCCCCCCRYRCCCLCCCYCCCYSCICCWFLKVITQVFKYATTHASVEIRRNQNFQDRVNPVTIRE